MSDQMSDVFRVLEKAGVDRSPMSSGLTEIDDDFDEF
jgi:hypothetical protein